MILQGDARALPLADGTVQCVVTSPPYWGLRDYGLPPSVWDAEPGCVHVWGDEARSAQRTRNGNGSATLEGAAGPIMLHPGTGAYCLHCPAWRGVLGLEPTPELYVAHLVAIFREVRRVLRADGTCWVNLGDSYAGSWGNQGRTEERGTQRPINGPMLQNLEPYPKRDSHTGSWVNGHPTLKPKDLVGIPWRVAFALQAGGWYLRADIIWAKPNPMPESVTDRPTKAHEYLFLLAKSERYYYDAEAVRERTGHEATPEEYAAADGRRHFHAHDAERGMMQYNPKFRAMTHPAGRNRRSVWTIATEPYPEAHFATFPEALVVPCVLAGTSEAGACAACGAPWEREVEREPNGGTWATDKGKGQARGILNRPSRAHGADHVAGLLMLGWRRTCACFAPRRPCLVLDPFGGSGTVGAVAERLGRRWIAVDLKPEYLALARRRTAQRGLPFLAAPANGNGHHPQIEIAGTV